MYQLALEHIGWDIDKLLGDAERFVGTWSREDAKHFSPSKSSRPWVALLTGLSDQYGFDRVFLDGKPDFSEANSVGSRGVRLIYLLEDWEIYEVHEHVSRARSRRYFLRIDGGEAEEIDREEVVRWLTERTA